MFVSRSVVDELDDPLSFYEQKISNQVQINNMLIAYETLEKAVENYKDDLRYQNAPRYLKLWLIYSFYQNNPTFILQWLIDNCIGHKLSILYEVTAYQYLKEGRMKEAERSLLLGIENMAIPIKRLKRIYHQFKTNNSIEFKEQEFNLGQYNANIQIIDKDHEHLLLYTHEDFIEQDQPLMTQLNWLNVQLQHHARASILREVYYKNQEVSLEELRIKYNPAKSIIKKWRSQEPVVLKPCLIQGEVQQQSTKRLIQEQHVFSLQPHDQPVKRGQKHIKERILKQQHQQTIFQASQIQKQQQQTKLSQPQKVLKKPTLGKTLLFATETPATAVSQIESAHPPVESKQKDIMVTRKEGVVELPHSPEFVHDQINKSGARVCSTYHIIKESASNTQKMLSSWFVYDKKKRLWKPSTKKEKHSLVHLLESEFLVVSKLGEGGMAQVFLVQETDSLAFYGLKVQQPPNPWEFYIHYQINERKKQNKTPFHLLPVLNYYYYTDTSFLLMPYIRHGTLLDAYNRYIAAQKTMPEPIIALFTARFIQQVILLHSLDICHNDLKLDNVMLISRRKDTMPDVVLIDFGHSIDVRVLDYPQCKASWPPACPLSGYPQFNTGYNPIHADYWELAAMSHRLLFGEPMQAICTHEGKFIIQQKFKRYWHVNLWSMLFECLLNRSNEQTDINLLLQEFDKIQVHDKLIHECIQVLTK